MGGMSIVSALILSRRTSAAFFTLGTFWGGFAALVPVIKAGLAVDDGLFGLLLLGSSFGLVTATWLAPRADRLLGARGMQFAALGMAVVWQGMGLVSLPWMFAFTMVFLGMSSGLLDVIMNSRVSELEARSGRSLMNVNHAMFSLGYALSAIATGIAREAGWGAAEVFAMLGLLALGVALYLRAPAALVSAEEGYAGGYPLVTVLLCGAIVLVAFSSEATVESWSALHVERTLGGGAAEGALGPAMLGLTMAFGRFSGQAVAERFHEVPVIIGASLLSAAGAVIAALAPTPLVAYIGFGTLGLGVSVVGPMALALVGKLVPPHLRTEAISKAAVMGFSGFFFAPVFMGLTSEMFGLRAAFVGVGLFLCLSVPLALMLQRHGRRLARSSGL
jgi:MFS family permease